MFVAKSEFFNLYLAINYSFIFINSAPTIGKNIHKSLVLFDISNTV